MMSNFLAYDSFLIPPSSTQNSAMAGNQESNPNIASRVFVVPMLDIKDWYKFVGTASSEALSLVPDTEVQTTLGMVMDSTTAYTTITLTSTAGLYAASVISPGFVVIENEVIKYTGISGNTITGVLRAQYGTSMQNHWGGDIVYQGQWFTIINGGALLAGYAKPV